MTTSFDPVKILFDDHYSVHLGYLNSERVEQETSTRYGFSRFKIGGISIDFLEKSMSPPFGYDKVQSELLRRLQYRAVDVTHVYYVEVSVKGFLVCFYASIVGNRTTTMARNTLGGYSSYQTLDYTLDFDIVEERGNKKLLLDQLMLLKLAKEY